MNRKDDKDEWRRIPSGGGWHEWVPRLVFLVVAIALGIILLGRFGVLPVNLLPPN
jgi:hypothetical protein